MCAPGDTVDLELLVDARLSHSGRSEVKTKPVDRCVAPLVAALEAGGVHMLGSCCGHGRGPGEIVLADGRTLRVLPAPTDELEPG